MRLVRVIMLFVLTFIFFMLSVWIQKVIIVPSEAFLFYRNDITAQIVLYICIGISLYIVITWEKLNEFYYYARLFLLVIALLVSLLDYSYFTENLYVHSKFGFKKEVSLSESTRVTIYKSYTEPVVNFHYNIEFSSGRVARISDEDQPFAGDELLALDKIIREYVNEYVVEDFSDDDIEKISMYKIEIINDHKHE